jgi:tetratricopeptide (TPR) repeat protein
MRVDPNELLRRALALHEQGRGADARPILLQLRRAFPEQIELVRMQAVVEAKLGRHGEAAALFDAVLARQPGRFDARLGRANALLALRRYDDALADFDEVLEREPGNAAVLHDRGLVLHRLARHAQALADFDRAIGLEAGEPVFHNSRGMTLLALRRIDEAIESFDRAIALTPGAEAYAHRGNALFAAGRVEDALADYERVVSLRPMDARAHYNRGIALTRLTRYADAVDALDKATDLQSGFVDALVGRGNALRELERNEDALASYDRALAIDPLHVDALNNRANTLWDLDRHDAALAGYDRALAIQPNHASARFNKGLLKLLRGEYEEGWLLHEARWGSALRGAARSFAQPLWLGETGLEGRTILLHAEQGLGDTLQFCRYAALVKARGARVVLEVPAALARLMQTLDGVDRIVVRGERLPEFDVHCPLMSLPLALRGTVETIPARVPYLHAEPALAAAWRARVAAVSGARPRVGLVWSGGRRPDLPHLWLENARRDIAPALLAPLPGVAGIEFFSLQKGEDARSGLRDIEAAGGGGRVIDFTEELADFADTAALVDALDLVISVDTAVAHLAAAMGKPVWLMNRYDTCWRWMLRRTDSPWYPTVTQFRQPAPGAWRPVVAAIRERLIARFNR